MGPVSEAMQHLIVSGASVNTPVMLRVRRRITEHGGQDLDAPTEWLNWSEQASAPERSGDRELFVAPAKQDDDLWA